MPQRKWLPRLFNTKYAVRVVLAMSPTLAVTNDALSGLSLGLAAALVLTGTTLVIAAVRSFLPERLRTAVYVLTVATFTSMTGMLAQAYFPVLYDRTGRLWPLLVVSCLVLLRGESVYSNPFPLANLTAGWEISFDFILAMAGLGALRELLDQGTLLGWPVLAAGIAALPAATFILLGLLLFGFNLMTSRSRR